MTTCMNRSEILKVLMPERTKQIALAWSILRQSHLSEDAYQDMLARVLERQEIFEGPQHLRDWSWKVLRNRCFELVRQRKYRVVLLDESVLDLVDSELEQRSTIDLPLRSNALHECLERLTAQSLRTIRMRYFEGLRGNQIAERLGKQPSAIYKALQRIYVSLAQCIEKKLAAIDERDLLS